MSDTSFRSRQRKGGAPKGNKNALGNNGGKGGPLKYDPGHHPHVAHKLCAMGFTDAQLAEFFEVNEATINRWKVEHVEFMQALTVGKAETDALVERSVLKGITGYYVETEEINAKGALKKIKKWIPGNPGVGMRWLSCRKPEIYRERSEKVQKHEAGNIFLRFLERIEADGKARTDHDRAQLQARRGELADEDASTTCPLFVARHRGDVACRDGDDC